MSYDPNKFVHEQPYEFFNELLVWPNAPTIVGRRWNSSAIVIDFTILFENDEPDRLVMLIVEEDDDHPDYPFVITSTRPWAGNREVREDEPEYGGLPSGPRYETLRDATIMWEHFYG